MFESIIGNSHIKAYLERMVNHDRIGNSMLFSGPEGIGKALFAESLAKKLIGTACRDHPDIRHFRPEGKIGMHSIESMRRFSEEVYLAPFESTRKIFIIHDAHRMLSYSANALLKTFEEPSVDTVIILLSHAPELLLPTVLSRCRTIHFHRIADEEIAAFLLENRQCEIEKARAFARLADGSIGRALSLYEQEGDSLRKRVLDFLAIGRVAAYQDLKTFTDEIYQAVESQKKEVGAHTKEGFAQGFKQEDLSAHIRHKLEKEVEGAIAMKQAAEGERLFDLIITWYRDLHLLHIGGSSRLLIHSDYKSDMLERLKNGAPTPIEKVQEYIASAKLSLSRSTSLNLCLENLFLKLGLF